MGGLYKGNGKFMYQINVVWIICVGVLEIVNGFVWIGDGQYYVVQIGGVYDVYIFQNLFDLSFVRGVVCCNN